MNYDRRDPSYKVSGLSVSVSGSVIAGSCRKYRAFSPAAWTLLIRIRILMSRAAFVSRAQGAATDDLRFVAWTCCLCIGRFPESLEPFQARQLAVRACPEGVGSWLVLQSANVRRITRHITRANNRRVMPNKYRSMFWNYRPRIISSFNR